MSELKEAIKDWDEATKFTEILFEMVVHTLVMDMQPDDFTKAKFVGFDPEDVFELMSLEMEKAGFTADMLRELTSLQNKLMDIIDNPELSKTFQKMVKDFVYQDIPDGGVEQKEEEVLEA